MKPRSQQLTGVLTNSGSINLTGSINASEGFTGSLQGTSSYAVTASYVLGQSSTTTASYALTSSYTNNIFGQRYFIPVYTGANTLASSSIYQSGSFTSIRYETAPEDPNNPDILYVAGYGVDTYNLISAHSDLDGYIQLNVQNFSPNSTASSDIVATADTGNEIDHYIDMGINGSGYNDPNGVGNALDAYLYSTGQDLLIGNATDGNKIIIFNGDGPALNNARVYIDSIGTVGINASTPTVGNPESLLVQSINNTTYNLIKAKGNVNNFLQSAIANSNTGSKASADIVAYNDLDPNSSAFGFIDMGINSSQFNDPINYPGWNAGDSYVYTDAPRFTIGSSNTGSIDFYVGDLNPTSGSKFVLRANNSHSLSGSLNISGSVIAFSFTGSLLGTSSWAYNAVSSSYASTASSADRFVVRNSLTASGLNYPTTDGTFSSQVMKTDAAGNLSFGNVETVFDFVYNAEATTLIKGTPVYVSGSQGANPKVYRADAADPSKMPVIYIISEAISAGAIGRGVALGHIEGIDLTGYPEGEDIYVAAGGSWTNVRPTGSAIIQFLGLVTKTGNGGKGLVLNPGAASLPNLNSGSVWVGDYNSYPVAIATSSIKNVISSSYASTASYAPLYLPLTGGTINGNIVLNGTASIAYLNVTYESASVIFSSGSNQFGDATSDIQTLIGRVLVSGSLEVTGSANLPSITGSLLGTSSFANNAVSASFATTASFASSTLTASFASTASYVLQAVTSSFATTSATASYILRAVSSSFATTSATASYILQSISSSFATSAATASYILQSVSSSFASTASFVITAQTASYVLNAISSSFASNTATASYALTASYTPPISPFPYSGSAIITGSMRLRGVDTGSANVLFVENNALTPILSITNAGSGSFTGSFGVQGGSGNVAATDFYFTATGFAGDNTLKISNGNGFTSAGVTISRTSYSNARAALTIVGGNTTALYISSAGTITFDSAGNTTWADVDGNYIQSTTSATHGAGVQGMLYNTIGGGSTASHIFRKGRSLASTGTGAIVHIYANYTENSVNSSTTPMLRIAPTYNLSGTGVRNMIGFEYDPTVTAITGSHYGVVVRSGLSGFGIGLALPSASVHVRAVDTGSVFRVDNLTSASIFTIDNNGSGSFIGFLTATGSLVGTSSWAVNAVSASYFSGSISNAATATSASYALTASYALNGGSGGASFPYTGSAIITGSLIVTGSVSLGDPSSPAVYTSIKTTVNSGSTTIYNMPTTSYDGAFFDYVLKGGAGARAGNIIAVWSGSGVSYTDNSTSDLGSTSGFTFNVVLSGSNMVLTSAVATNGWTLKTAVRTI